jgi:hypothetical protein
MLAEKARANGLPLPATPSSAVSPSLVDRPMNSLPPRTGSSGLKPRPLVRGSLRLYEDQRRLRLARQGPHDVIERNAARPQHARSDPAATSTEVDIKTLTGFKPSVTANPCPAK